uniref:Transmembrane 4 L6 family member 1 n=1 Tax=Anser cygnoides TaxID=8845 RepID=A0A8B9DR75_ANSCY
MRWALVLSSSSSSSPSPCRQAMCVGRCSRIVGPCLLALGTLSVIANILLLFPGGAWKYLVDGHITKQAKVMPGIWGGGITVLLVATHITAVGWRCAGCSDSLCSPQAFLSAVLSKLALLGSAACFILSGVGLTNGPLCLYNASEHGHGPTWGYPFLDTGSQPDTWDTCLEPAGIVAWNVALFSLLLLVSAAEMVLASIQILNGCAGCLCGFCEGKQGRPTRLD